MEKLKRGDKIYLDKNQTKESTVNTFLECRDGIVEVYKALKIKTKGGKN